MFGAAVLPPVHHVRVCQRRPGIEVEAVERDDPVERGGGYTALCVDQRQHGVGAKPRALGESERIGEQHRAFRQATQAGIRLAAHELHPRFDGGGVDESEDEG